MKRKNDNSHITYEGRKIIEERLNEGASITEIANEMCRPKCTIIREINRHILFVFPSIFNNTHPCIKYANCPVKEFDCYKTCKNIEINLCPKLTSSPHICNSCDSKKRCRYVKKYYKAYEANCEYLNSLKDSRIGFRYSENELEILNTDFYYLVINSKSIYHSLIVINNLGFNFKQSSIYRQIKLGKLKLKNSDLPRQRSIENQKPDREYKNINSIKGHTYEDFEEYKKNHKQAIESQMDTVIGTINANDPVILTLEIIEISFMFIFKLNSKTFKETLDKLKYFKNTISTETFNKIFEILLTDNGSEFKNVSTIIEEFPNINIFYCHPYSSFEKGNLENNHELIRRVIPKGVSLKAYTQQDYNKLSSHINSLYRKKLNGKCPFDLIENYISKDILNKLGLKKVPDTKVNLTPFLLGNKNIENIKKYLTYDEIKNSNISIHEINREEINDKKRDN